MTPEDLHEDPDRLRTPLMRRGCRLQPASWNEAFADIKRTNWVLVIGANPAVSNGSLWTVPDFRGRAKAPRARGGKLVVIDPRRNETAALADCTISSARGSTSSCWPAWCTPCSTKSTLRKGLRIG